MANALQTQPFNEKRFFPVRKTSQGNPVYITGLGLQCRLDYLLHTVIIIYTVGKRVKKGEKSIKVSLPPPA